MADAKKWKSGDRVKLASGGPLMTVKRVYTPAYESVVVVECQWFDENNKLQEAEFSPESLEADTV